MTEQREPVIVAGWFRQVHRWPVSDCTAEAVCALLALHGRGPIPDFAKLSDEPSAKLRSNPASSERTGGFGF